MMFASPSSSGSFMNAVQGNHTAGRSRQRSMVTWITWMETLNGRLWIFALRLNQAGLKVDDVVAKLIVFGLKGFEVAAQYIIITDLFLELLDIALFALPEGPLVQVSMLDKDVDWRARASLSAHLCCSVLSGSFAGTQFPLAKPFSSIGIIAVVATSTGPHRRRSH